MAESRGISPDDFPDRLFDDTRQFYERTLTNGPPSPGWCLAIAGDQGIRRFYLYATASGRPMYERAGFTNHRDWMVVQVPRD